MNRRRVKRKKRRQQQQLRQESAYDNLEEHGPVHVPRLVSSEHPTYYQATHWLDEELTLYLRVTVSLTGDVLLSREDWTSAALLWKVTAG